jgi:hypothetical protein
MSWNCEACTYSNSNASSYKCAICDTIRSDVPKQDGKLNAEQNNNIINSAFGLGSSTDHITIKSRKRPRDHKSTVQSTLFAGVVVKGTEKGKSNSSKSKPVPTIFNTFSTNQTSSLSTFVVKQQQPSTTPTAIRFIFWKQCFNSSKSSDNNGISLIEFENRTRTAMKNLFQIDTLRFLQPKAIKCALKRKSQIIVMATGGGMYIF